MSLETLRTIGLAVAMLLFLWLFGAFLPAVLDWPAWYSIPQPLDFLVIFPLWAAVIFYLNKTTSAFPEGSEQSMKTGLDKWKMLLQGRNRAVLIFAAIFYAIGLYCLLLMFAGKTNDPSFYPTTGQWEYHDHGIVHVFTEAEAHAAHQKSIFASAGFSMVFASAAIFFFWPKNSEAEPTV